MSSVSPAEAVQGFRGLSYRFRLESFLLQLSAAFLKAPIDDLDRQIEIWLRRLTQFMQVDRCSFWEQSGSGGSITCQYFHCAAGMGPPESELLRHRYPWLTRQYRRGVPIVWSRVPEQIPACAAPEREHAMRIGAKSVLSIPLATGSSIWVLALVSTRRYCTWTDGMVQRMTMVGEIFASAMLRQRAEISLRLSQWQLRESEERFRGAFDNAAIGMALVSPEGRWLKVNQALTRIFGYSEEELRDTTFQAISHPDDLSSNLEYLRRALGGDIDHYELEKRYIHKDGHTIFALLSVSLVRDALGRPLYFVSQIHDLSERTRAQLEIDQLRLELTHSSRVALMGQLTGSLAHELLQPVTAMSANAEAALSFLAAGEIDVPAMLACLNDIVESCGRAAHVIQRVNSLLRKERRPRRRIDLNQLVREVARVMRSDLMTRRVRLVMQLDEQLPDVMGDAVELQQVILNLIVNGAEAVSHDSCKNRDLLVATIPCEQEVELRVRDQGAGAEPENLERMFEPFFSTKPNGMGLGLPICSEIARAHGGRLWAENNADAGLTVHVTLPVAG
ncbi:MAG TPA: PAS domain S-box protein [Steroidobacteraceae bacterium]|nr:PAS domain S-box protein [Steroidobacteraceae bacterium]